VTCNNSSSQCADTRQADLTASVEEPSLEAIYTRYFETHEGELHAA